MSVSDTRPEHAIGRVVDDPARAFDGTFTTEEVSAADHQDRPGGPVRARRGRGRDHGVRGPCPVLPGKHYLDWDVGDPVGQPLPVVRGIRDDVERRVGQLLRDLDLS